MTHDKLIKILAIIRPGAQWVLRGDTLVELEWLDQVQSAPTQDDIDAGELLVDSLAYQESRKEAYPPLGDQFDALWKCLQKLKTDGVVLGTDADDMIDAVNAVKAQFPKPE